MIRRWWLVVLVWIAPVAHVHAQDEGSFRTSSAGMDFYAVLETDGRYVRDVARSWLERRPDEVRTLLSSLSMAWDAPSGPGDEGAICGVVVGMGGNPKVDGGGGLEMLASPFVGANELSSIDLAPALGADVPSIAIIDEFALTALAAALRDEETQAFRNLGEVVASGGVLKSGFTTTAVGPVAAVDVVHGHLVLHHVLSILHGLDAAIEGIEFGTGHGARTTLSLTVGGSPVALYLYDIEFVALNGLQEALDDIFALPEETVPIPLAVVMSWGLTGCDLEAAYARFDGGAAPAAQNDTAIQTVAEFLYDAVARLAERDAIVSEVCAALEADRAENQPEHPSEIPCEDEAQRNTVGTVVALAQFELLAWERVDWKRRGDVVFFASSGNQSLPFAMPPASFGSVVAVAACMPTSTQAAPRAWFSNAGDDHPSDGSEAIALGAWFAAPAIDGLETAGYWGTSFAAPFAAVASRRSSATAGDAVGTSHRWPNSDDLCQPIAANVD